MQRAFENSSFSLKCRFYRSKNAQSPCVLAHEAVVTTLVSPVSYYVLQIKIIIIKKKNAFIPSYKMHNGVHRFGQSKRNGTKPKREKIVSFSFISFSTNTAKQNGLISTSRINVKVAQQNSDSKKNTWAWFPFRLPYFSLVCKLWPPSLN